MKPLTARQSEIFEFIKKFFVENQRMASIVDISKAFGFASTNSAFDHLRCLERKGVIDLVQDIGVKHKSIKLVNYDVILVDRVIKQ